MINLTHLLTLVDRYKIATGKEDVTVSNRVFADGKKLAALRGAGDITTTRFNAAILWFSENWPEGAEWPENVERPVRREAVE